MQLLQRYLAKVQKTAQNMASGNVTGLANSKLGRNAHLVRSCHWLLQQDTASIHKTAQNRGHSTPKVYGIAVYR